MARLPKPQRVPPSQALKQALATLFHSEQPADQLDGLAYMATLASKPPITLAVTYHPMDGSVQLQLLGAGSVDSDLAHAALTAAFTELRRQEAAARAKADPPTESASTDSEPSTNDASSI